MHLGVHYTSCPRAGLPLPQPTTAYERDQQALRDRVDAIEAHANEIAVTATLTIGRLADRVATLERSTTPARAVDTERRLDAALRRIEALEVEVAKLKGPREPVPEPPFTHLPCGCWNDVHGCRGHASPATAYPPLPDEGT